MHAVAGTGVAAVVFAGTLAAGPCQASAATGFGGLHPQADFLGLSVPVSERAGAVGRRTASVSAVAPDGLPGLDVSRYQKTVDWPRGGGEGC
ncbi:hypothetical protein GCM10017567_13630 [Amycolatopsis bullii]|uniref:Secreted protein n=1 Tax=Amycolatopsis bullii TaxID=941987 RepID=A0ABQ3K1M4_9PSEU|nr:hypothetical protein GCM10017567_13630 [Amycolatopsis bullii]